MKNKKFFFLTGIMRCGNTVLTSLINQNPNLCITPNSIVPEIIFRLYNLKNDPIFDEQKDHKSFDSVIKSVLDNYYKELFKVDIEMVLYNSSIIYADFMTINNDKKLSTIFQELDININNNEVSLTLLSEDDNELPLINVLIQ